METRVKYGRGELEISIPNSCDVTIVESRSDAGYADPDAEIRRRLNDPIDSPPLTELLEAVDTVGVIFSDITRATPNSTILPPILDACETAGIKDSNVRLFNATGTHRTNTESELRELLGSEIAGRYRVVQNVATGSGFTQVGTTRSGNDILINEELLQCDLRILTGYIEPHFFAGFSGGGKAVMPGCAALETIRRNHSPLHIDHELASWGILDGNPIAEEVVESIGMVGACFLLNITLNRSREITGVFAGDVQVAHKMGSEFVKARAMQGVSDRFDIVVTSNAGYPLDGNLYQSVKGLSAASRIVRDGGDIIVCAACDDGIPDHGSYARLLASTEGPGELLHQIRNGEIDDQDIWQVQIQARIAERAHTHLYTTGLTPDEVKRCHFEPTSSVSSLLKQLVQPSGDGTSVCVLPEGPETIPYLI